jgi:hypothetical protein
MRCCEYLPCLLHFCLSYDRKCVIFPYNKTFFLNHIRFKLHWLFVYPTLQREVSAQAL